MHTLATSLDRGMALHVCFADFELDEARFELKRAGEVVPVQPKVMELLLHLVRHRERVVTKDELFATVWDGAVVTEASLSHAVSLARRALGDSPQQGRFLRTVRRKGLQFVGEVHEQGRARPGRVPHSLIETAQETQQAPPPTEEASRERSRLFAVLHGGAPEVGGASWSLDGIDEVRLGRASRLRSERAGDVSGLLNLGIPERQLSRDHVRLLRGARGWVLVDQDSRNGTYVDGERTQRRSLENGDVFRCGRSVFQFAVGPDPGAPIDTHHAEDNLLSTVTPVLWARATRLARVAGATLPILVTGPSGAGKTHLAKRIHGASARTGSLCRLEASTLDRDLDTTRRTLDAAADGTVLIENVERIGGAAAATLASMLEGAPTARVVATSIASDETLQEQLPPALYTRLAGHVCALPALCERRGDLGALVASIACELDLELDARAAMAVVRYAWPGNLRELSHTLESAVRVSAGDKVRLEHLPPALSEANS